MDVSGTGSASADPIVAGMERLGPLGSGRPNPRALARPAPVERAAGPSTSPGRPWIYGPTAAASAQRAAASPPLLFLLCLSSVALNMKHVQSLRGIPEDIVLQLFWGTLQLGGMTEPVLRVFLDTRHEELLRAVERLGLKTTHRAVLPTRCGDK